MIRRKRGSVKRAGARFASSLDIAYAGGRRPYHVDAIDQAINLFVEGSLLHVHGPASLPIRFQPKRRGAGARI